jgi:hypothetical protein
MGIIDYIFKILREVDVEEVIKASAIYLSIQLLKGGNVHGQQAFYEAFKSDETNGVLQNVLGLLTDNFEDIEACMTEKNDQEIKRIVNAKDELGEDGSIPEGTSEDNRSAKKSIEAGVKHGRRNSVTVEDFEKTLSKTQAAEYQVDMVQGQVSNITDDLDSCSNIFNFFQLLCEGHNKQLQDALRSQDFRQSKSLCSNDINIIKFSSSMFARFLKIANPVDVDMGYQLIDFMIEAIQGPCHENQNELFNHKVVEFIKEYLNDVSDEQKGTSFIWGSDTAKLSLLIKRLIKLLNAMIEANDDYNLMRF